MISSAADLIALIDRIGFLPLLDSGISGFSAEEMVSDDCRYQVFPDGGWDWPLWKWKGSVVTESHCAYGKFFAGKAGFISREWWPDFCAYRRSLHEQPEEGSIDDSILSILRLSGSAITRDLRAACGFNGPKMRSRFDSYITRLQSAGYIVTEDFVYPRDRHGNEYGWGWALLTTPEQLFGADHLSTAHSPEEARRRIETQLRTVVPGATDRQIQKLIG